MPKSVSEILLESASLKQKLAADKEFISLIENLAELMTAAFRDDKKVLFCGNGSKKLQPLITTPNASFSETNSNASHLAELSCNRFRKKQFADLAYTEPLYIKEFYTTARKG